jgi:hypothetical protein
LLQVSERLRPSGVAVIRIPLADGEAWERYGVDWFQLDAPRHLHLQTRKSMGLLAGRAHLCIASWHCDSDYQQFAISERYRHGVPMVAEAGVASAGFRLEKEQIERFKAEARRLNAQRRGDQAAFYLVAAPG